MKGDFQQFGGTYCFHLQVRNGSLGSTFTIMLSYL